MGRSGWTRRRDGIGVVVHCSRLRSNERGRAGLGVGGGGVAGAGRCLLGRIAGLGNHDRICARACRGLVDLRRRRNQVAIWRVAPASANRGGFRTILYFSARR